MGLGDLSKLRGNNTDSNEGIVLGASKEIEEKAIEHRKMLEQVDKFIEKEGLQKRTYVDDAGNEVIGLFRSDNSEMSISELWSMNDGDLPTLNPEEQRELTSFWKRYNIEFKDINPEGDLEEEFGGFFDRLKGGK